MIDLHQQFIENRIRELKLSTDFVNNLLKCITGYAIMVCDFDGNVIVFNDGAQNIFGLSAQEAVGLKNIEDFYPQDFIKAGNLNRLFDKLIFEGESRYELERIRKNGETFPGQSLLTLVRDNEGRLVGFVEITEDITDRKIAQSQLENANKRLIELNSLKDSFLSMASHELRTPLTSIINFTEILMDYDEDRDTRNKFLRIIDQESERLLRIINDFLDISKIQAGRMQFKVIELSLNEIVQQVVSSNKPLIENAKLEVITDLDPDIPPVINDRDRLIQVMTNLLGNSIKFTPEPGRITIKSSLQKSCTKRDDKNKVIVSISDTGIGIASENHARIFENFGQVANTLKNQPRGTGLGLPICKKIIEYFGGNIWVESELGKGSTFYFSLPVEKEPSFANTGLS
jgi:PAS domain S-box-containing protein